jgi:hypothetical protein
LANPSLTFAVQTGADSHSSELRVYLHLRNSGAKTSVTATGFVLFVAPRALRKYTDTREH